MRDFHERKVARTRHTACPKTVEEIMGEGFLEGGLLLVPMIGGGKQVP